MHSLAGITMNSKKSQETLIGFMALLAIGLVVITAVFTWAWPNIQKAQNQDEVFRLENRMVELHNAIKRAASEQGMLTVPFTIKKGSLFLSTNNSITYKGNFRLPQAYQERILLGNRTGVYVGAHEAGTLGKDEPAYLMERGSIEFVLKYLMLNNTADGKCYQISLRSGDQGAAGKGDHIIFVKWIEENTTVVSGCNTTTQQIMSINMQ